MKQFLCVAFLLAASHVVFSQVLQERVNINGGSELWPNFVKEMFLYPEFRQGTVEYKDGQLFRRAMNYNKVLETIQFIDENNDTLAIANEAAVRRIIIDSDIFTYTPACTQVVTPDLSAKLYKHEAVRIADVRRRGVYGIPNSTASMDNISQIYASMNSYDLDVNEVILLSKTTTFFISTDKNQFLPASRKNVLRVYASKKQAINNFINEKNTNFSKEKDLVALMEFISRS